MLQVVAETGTADLNVIAHAIAVNQLPVVESIADERAAEALDEAARWLTGTGTADDGLAPDVTSDGLSWRNDVRSPNNASDWFEQSLRDRAAALRATSQRETT